MGVYAQLRMKNVSFLCNQLQIEEVRHLIEQIQKQISNMQKKEKT